ncbi:SHOCT domain-containing protein [Nocardia bovistercoris]|uniref:SHOCT domain-containing protein n=1 Tax=Nocardia bovistercoris TaxID=2785916 RepID=A0A931N5I6_9NOCA|nr:SHOCT domain-containing protein [Nocardia bovistercoris]MBH0779451.1 SHOCT domain-containing protein [Nocardia bovistercoris]
MPGLLRGVVRTAAIAGTATAVSNRVSRRQGERWAAERSAPPQPAPEAFAAVPSAPVADPVAAMRQLGEMKSQGLLTDDEFAAMKAKILAS